MTDNANPEDTGQISVAELLARNGQKSASSSTGGRRRRGVKGGISVAELTGEIPIVRGEAGSSEAPVIEPSAQQAPAPEKIPAAEKTPAPAPVRKSPEATRPEPELLSGSTTAAGDLLNKAHDESERRPYGATQSQRPATERPATDRPARTTGFVARSRTSRFDEDVRSGDDAEQRTEVTPAVRDTERPRTRIEPKFPAAAEAPDAPTEVTPAVADTTSDPDPKTAVADKVGDDTPAAKPAAAADADTTDTVEAHPGKKGAAKQWLVLAGQGVVAVVVGALLFKGFESLWDMLPWVALVLSVLVIVGLVAVVRILRRTDDLISMVIAIAVGVFVTLGPLAFQLSTG